jgi:hypothetical protein
LQKVSLGHPPVAGRRPLVAGRPWPCQAVTPYFLFFLFKIIFLGSLGNGPGLLEEWVCSIQQKVYIHPKGARILIFFGFNPKTIPELGKL